MSPSNKPRSSVEDKRPDIVVYLSPETALQKWLHGGPYHSSGGDRVSNVSAGAASKVQSREGQCSLLKKDQDHPMSEPAGERSWHETERWKQIGKLFRTEGKQVQYADPARFTDEEASRQSILREERFTTPSGWLSAQDSWSMRQTSAAFTAKETEMSAQRSSIPEESDKSSTTAVAGFGHRFRQRSRQVDERPTVVS